MSSNRDQRTFDNHHSTVKEACEIAAKYDIQNLVLYHTEDDHLKHRREFYTAEGRNYFKGNLFVPDDLESIDLYYICKRQLKYERHHDKIILKKL